MGHENVAWSWEETVRPATSEVFDVIVLGGGINGCGIAHDAADRNLQITPARVNDLASATSSAFSKQFHGSPRDLEHTKFRFARESPVERETLCNTLPHICWPMSLLRRTKLGLHSTIEAARALGTWIAERRMAPPAAAE